MKTPEQMFEHELSAVFVRWWEEADIDDLQIAEVAMGVIERFCGESVEFDAEFELTDEGDIHDEGDDYDVGFEYDQEN